jgi:hypothetical protein
MTHQGALPPIDENVTLADRSWCASHRGTLFRASTGNGGVWLILSRPQAHDPDAYLSTLSPVALPDDSDDKLAAAWQPAAYPLLPSEQAQKAVRKAPRESG